jgi:hypothetical protein
MPLRFRFRDRRISGHGEGRYNYIVDVEDGYFKYLCTVEGMKGEWFIHGVGEPNPENPNRRRMGPFLTREAAATAYFRAFNA